MRSRHFTVTGEVAEQDLRRAAEDLEAFRAALSRLYAGSAVESQVPTWVVIFDEHRRFQRFAPRDTHGRPFPHVGGYFFPDPDLNYIVFGRYGRDVDRRVILHEYAHAVLHRTMGAIPLWLSEGLADFYSTFERNPRVAGSLVGRPPADLLSLLRSKDFIGLDRIVTPRDTDLVLKDGGFGRMFYAESWALVHYLLVGSEHAQDTNVAVFLSELARGTPTPQAFATAFGETIDEADAALRRYIRQETYGGIAVEAGETAAAPTSEKPLTSAERHRVQGDLLLRLGSLAEAETELAQALAEDPRDHEARIALARTKLRTVRHDEGIAELERVAAEAPASFAAQYYLGAALTLRRRFEEALHAFNRAVWLRDTSASAWFGFSTVALAIGLDDSAEASLRRAMQIEFNPSTYRNHAYAAFGFGRHEIMAADARRFFNAVGLRDTSAQELAFLTAVAYWKTRQPRQAEALLDDVRKVAPRSSWNADVVDFMQGRTGADHLLGRARTPAQRTSAHTYIGLKAAVEGRTDDALAHLRWVRAEGERSDPDYGVAIEELARLEMSLLELR